MIGHGHVGDCDWRQIAVDAASNAKLLDPIGRDVWVRVSTNLAQQLGQGTGMFLAHKRSELTRAQRIQIIAEEALESGIEDICIVTAPVSRPLGR